MFSNILRISSLAHAFTDDTDQDGSTTVLDSEAKKVRARERWHTAVKKVILARRFIQILDGSLSSTRRLYSFVPIFINIPMYYPAFLITKRREIMHPALTPYKGLFRSLSMLYQQQGYRSLYVGFPTSIIIELIGYATEVSVKYKVENYLRGKGEPTVKHRIISNVVSSIASSLACAPIAIANLLMIANTENVPYKPFVREWQLYSEFVRNHGFLTIYNNTLFKFTLMAGIVDQLTTEFLIDDLAKWPYWIAESLFSAYVTIPFVRQFLTIYSKNDGYNMKNTIIQEVYSCLTDFKLSIDTMLPTLTWVYGTGILSLYTLMLLLQIQKMRKVDTTKARLKRSQTFFW